MTTKALVGPLPTVRFKGVRAVADPPQSTLDRRWDACTEHHLACDCREAEMNEALSEYSGELRAADEASRRILTGHPTRLHVLDPATGEWVDRSCQCTGCQLARVAHLWGGGYG